MSDEAWVIIAILTAATILGVSFLRYLGSTRPMTPSEMREMSDEPLPERYQSQPDPSEDFQPLPIDPANPPRVTAYNPKPGSEVRKCSCHDQPLAVYRPCVLWPLPNTEGEYLVFCEETLSDMDMKAPE